MKVLFNLNSLLLLIAIFVNLGLSLYILINNYRNTINRAFSALLFAVSFWSFGFFIFIQVPDPVWILLGRRIILVAASLIGSLFLYFTMVFPKRNKPLAQWQTLLILGPGIALAMLSFFTDLVINSNVVPGITTLSSSFGPLYGLFAFFFIVYFVSGITRLVFLLIHATEKEKLQIWYVTFGVFFSGFGSMIFSLILPLLGISQFFIYGPIFTLLLAAFVTYAIVRHRLLNIEDFISRGIVFLAVAALAVIIIGAIVNQSPYSLLPLFTIIANLTLGLIVFLKNPKNNINRSFCLLITFVGFWSLFNFLSDISNLYSTALFWNRMIFATSAFIPIFSILFAIYFPEGGMVRGVSKC